MEKTTTITLRINPELKQSAQEVFNQLGIPMATAVTMFFKQVSFTKSIPFKMEVPPTPPSVNADLMTQEEFAAMLRESQEDYENGRIQPFEEFMAEWKKELGI